MRDPSGRVGSMDAPRTPMTTHCSGVETARVQPVAAEGQARRPHAPHAPRRRPPPPPRSRRPRSGASPGPAGARSLRRAALRSARSARRREIARRASLSGAGSGGDGSGSGSGRALVARTRRRDTEFQPESGANPARAIDRRHLLAPGVEQAAQGPWLQAARAPRSARAPIADPPRERRRTARLICSLGASMGTM